MKVLESHLTPSLSPLSAPVLVALRLKAAGVKDASAERFIFSDWSLALGSDNCSKAGLSRGGGGGEVNPAGGGTAVVSTQSATCWRFRECPADRDWCSVNTPSSFLIQRLPMVYSRCCLASRAA